MIASKNRMQASQANILVSTSITRDHMIQQVDRWVRINQQTIARTEGIRGQLLDDSRIIVGASK